jgi:hypothetical protein
VIDGLVAGNAYHVALAAYTEDGDESSLSTELTLGDENPCTVDECFSPTECDIHPVPDGTWCAREGDTDPCTGVGTCVAGTCAAGPVAAGRLTTTRVRVTTRAGEGRLTARATFSATGKLDPTATGATFELADSAGRILYRASVPGEVFDGFRENTAFRYLTTRKRAREYNGLRMVAVFVSGRTATVLIRAESVELRAAVAQAGLRWTVRFGDSCARNLALTCRPMVAGGVSCR